MQITYISRFNHKITAPFHLIKHQDKMYWIIVSYVYMEKCIGAIQTSKKSNFIDDVGVCLMYDETDLENHRSS